MTMAFTVKDRVPSVRFETRDSASMLIRHVDIERADTSHLAFGGGAHFCLGGRRSRGPEAQIAIPLLFERFPQLAPRSPTCDRAQGSAVFNGLGALWVRAT